MTLSMGTAPVTATTICLGTATDASGAVTLALLSITTEPSGTFAVGSKYYNSTSKKIFTAITADSWVDAIESDPEVIPVYYLYDGSTYYWDGDSLEKTDTSDFALKATFVPTHILYVDNARTDSYTPDGSIIYPFKDVQSAHDAITGSSSTNTYEIKINTGLSYSGTLNLSKDYLTISGNGASKGAGFTGIVNISSQHLCVQNIHIKGGSTVNVSRVGHYLTEFKDCRASGVTFNLAATGTTAEKADTWIQISGGASLWLSNTIIANGVNGVLGMLAGSFEGNTITATDCLIQYGNCNALTNTTNLESGTTMQIGGGLYLGNTINLKTGATLQADITVFSVSNTLNNTGGTLTLLSPSNAIKYDNTVSGLTAANVKDAIDELETTKVADVKIADQSILDENRIAVIPNASNSVIGAIRIATDGEATTGTSEVLAVNPKQLKDKIDKYSTLPTATIDYVGIIAQYVGTTGDGGTNGYFYKGTSTPVDSIISAGIGTSTGITEASVVKATFEGEITETGTYNFIYNASTATADIGLSTGITGASVVVATFETLLNTTGDYVFTFDGTDWTYNGSVVTLADYGISVTGTPNENDIVTVSYVEADWKYDGDIVTLSDYGISVVGTPDDLDVVVIEYTASSFAYSWELINVQPATVVPDASNTVKGIIRIATDGEATTGTAENLAVNPKQLKDGLDSVSCGSNIPFSIKSANIGDKGEVDLFNISKFINSGCSFTGSVATGGSEKYVRLLETAPISTADSWVINVPKYTYNGGGSSYRAIIAMPDSSDFKTPVLLVDNSDILKFYASSDGGSWDIFFSQSTGVTLTAETAYWFRISFSSTTGYKIEYSTNGTDYTEAWTSATTTKSYCATPFMFLNNGENLTSGYSSGTMDFSTGSIIIDGTTWWTGNLNNTLSFKVDDGTSYAPLKVINPSGEEVTFTSISALDLSGFADGIINIFATATGVEARQNKIFMQTAEPTAENDGDVWIKGDVIKDWDETGSVWVATTVVAFLGSIMKNGFIENGYCFPLNYNGQIEMSCFNYVSGNIGIDVIAKSGFKFFGRYKNYLKGSNTTYKYPIPFFAFYDTSYCGIYAGGTTDLDFGSHISSEARDIFGYYSNSSKSGYVILQGYITI